MNMNRLKYLFGNKQNNILSVYFTAGYPHRDDTVQVIKSLVNGGVNMIEIGVPFSDPMADGVVIQESSNIALRNGMNLRLLLSQVEKARTEVPETPFVLMGYLNPMMQYGIEALFAECHRIGIDAMIIPDLPFADYMRDFKPLCDKYQIPIIMLITPETSNERIELIDKHCDGFIYMVSAASTTGTRERFEQPQLDYFERIAKLNLQNKRLIGFGISNRATLATANQYSSGAIIGSLFIKCLRQNPDNIAAAVTALRATLQN
jgi:tryptophan synthase alpha chain